MHKILNISVFIIPFSLFFLALILNKKNKISNNLNYIASFERSIAFIIDISICIGIYYIIVKILKINLSLRNSDEIIFFIISWLYFSVLESLKTSSIGKLFQGIEVRRTSGKRLNFFQSSIRFLLFNISTMGFCLGIIMIPFTKYKQGMHDIFLKTIVVKKKIQAER